MNRMPRQVRTLFDRLAGMPPAGRLEPVTPGSVIEGTSFFPGGWGIWNAPKNRRFPHGGVLVLGNTWGTRQYFDRVVDRGSEVVVTPDGGAAKDPTWKNLIRLLDGAGVDPENCFFTNAFPALVAGNIVGACGVGPRHPAWPWFQDFFNRTLQLMAPTHVLALGLEPIRFLGGPWTGVKRFADVSPPTVRDQRGFTAVALLHPSARAVNRDRLGRTVKEEAEILRSALG